MSQFEKKIIKRMLKNATDSMNLAIPDKYSHIDFTPPKGVQVNAKRALENRATKPASQRGMTPVGIARARDLINAKQLSPDTIRRMLAYFTRHEVDKQGETWGDYGKGRQAWDGWGGDEGYTWSKKVVNQMDKADEALKAMGEAMPIENQPKELIKGKPFLTLALGKVNSRMDGSEIGVVTMKDLEEMVRVFYERKEIDPVIIDWNHATSLFSNQIASPEAGIAFGQIADLEIKDNGLYAYPLYTSKGAKIVEESEGNLWSSPEFILGPVYAKDGGDKVGNAQLLAITLTPRPAQAQNKIDRILLSENIQMDQQELSQKSPEELVNLVLEKDALVKQLEAKLAAIEAEYEAAQQEDALEPNEPVDSPLAMGNKTDSKVNAMSEASAKLMNEMSIKITALNEQVNKLSQEKHNAERKNAIDALLNTGKISPAEKAVCEKAFDLKDKDSAFWNMFSERKPNQAVNLGEVGHNSASKPMSLSERIDEIKKQKGITFAQALDLFIKDNPTEYQSFFGV